MFWYVNQRCKFGLRSTPSAVRAIFESRYLPICFEILYETLQSCSMKSRMHVGKFSWFLKVFWYVNQRCKFGLRSTPSAVRAILRADISRSVLRFCVKLHSHVLRCQDCMSVNFHDFLRCLAMLTRGAKLGLEYSFSSSGNFWEIIFRDLFWDFCIKLHSLILRY